MREQARRLRAGILDRDDDAHALHDELVAARGVHRVYAPGLLCAKDVAEQTSRDDRTHRSAECHIDDCHESHA